MNCDCITDTEKRLLERVQQPDFEKPKNSELDSVLAQNIGLNFTTGKTELIIPFKAEWKLASGKRKETRINVMAEYCPFCGGKLR